MNVLPNILIFGVTFVTFAVLAYLVVHGRKHWKEHNRLFGKKAKGK